MCVCVCMLFIPLWLLLLLVLRMFAFVCMRVLIDGIGVDVCRVLIADTFIAVG